MKYLQLIIIVFLSLKLDAQAYIDVVSNDCPTPDILKVCIGEDNSYEGNYMFKTYDHFCGDDTITGNIRIFRNESGDYFVDDFSFGTWAYCYDAEEGPRGTLRLFIDCSEVTGVSGTDNFGDVWGTGNIEYTGQSLIISWFNSYPEFGTTELIPLDGTPITRPDAFLESEYDFVWNTGARNQSISTLESGTFSVTVSGPDFNGVLQTTIQEDATIFDENCSDQILEVSYFLDDNRNGTFDSGEKAVHPGEQYLSIEPSPAYKSIESSGHERYVVAAGNYLLDNVHPSLGFTNLPAQLDVQANSGILPLELGLYAEEMATDAHVDISSLSPERCNAAVPFRLTIRNTGTSAFNERIALAIPEELSYVNAHPMPANTEPELLEWDVPLPDHGDELQISLLLQMPDSEFIGETFCLTPLASAFTRSDDAFCFALRCAYDPNDKHGTPFSEDNNRVLPDATMKYTVRFENLGNDTAFNIRIEDQLDPGLDINSYRFIQSSHEVTRQYIRSDRTLVFELNQIELPSIEQDSFENKGFVQYAIEPVELLPEETVINNTADIFFDLNDAIVTNTTEHVIFYDLSSTESVFTHKNSLSVHPNPAGPSLFIDTGECSNQSLRYSITDINGTLLAKGIHKGERIEIQHLPKGIYFLNLRSECTGMQVVRFAKM